MRGIKGMNTGDLLDYFAKYSPAIVEWLTEDSCNIVWLDEIAAAKALFHLSSKIKGMPVEEPIGNETETNLFEDDEEKGKSILLKNPNREIEVQHEDMDDVSDGTIHVSSLSGFVPAGYWRLGESHPKSKQILMRFCLWSDKKPFRVEKFSEYYKKVGQNFGVVGISSETLRQKRKGIFDRNRDFGKGDGGEVAKNPWGDLAAGWDDDISFAERVVLPMKPKKVEAEDSELMNR